LVRLLKSDYADIYQQLLDEATDAVRRDLGDDGRLRYEPQDDDLSMLACRRTTFEWVLRRPRLAKVRIRTGIAVEGLV
jgi:hypothetical protein